MSIIGIDKEKCTNCGLCIQECVRGYFYLNEKDQVLYNTDLGTCIICGHCIAVCPEDAIITKDLDDIISFPGIDSPEDILESEKFLQFLRAKRSIRRYKKKKVPKELIEKVFQAMRYAPSASNAREWRYVILSNPEKIQQLSDEMVKVNYPYMGFQSAEQALAHLQSKNINLFYHAPHLIILYYKIVEKNNIILGLRGNDAGIALTYGMLEAETLGLGSCWIGLLQGAIPLNKEILKILGIRGMVLGAFTLGYPAVKYRKTAPRAPLKIKEIE